MITIVLSFKSAYFSTVTTLVSESSYNDSPVGVDFYFVGEGGNQFGTFGGR